MLSHLTLCLTLALGGDDPPNFEDHVEPVLRESCIKCHRGSRAKNGLELRSVESILRGGSSGPAIEVGDASSSLLFQLAAHRREPAMPPDGERLSDADLGILEAWIDAGALAVAGGPPAGASSPRAVELAFVPPPPPEGAAVMPSGLSTQPAWWTETGTPVRALAVSPSAPLVAIAGHRQISLYRVPEAELLGVLPFPEGSIHSLTFSANGGILLAGGGRGAERGLAVGFDVASGARVFAVGDEPDVVLAAAVGPDHWLVALGGPDRHVRSFSARTGEQLYAIDAHTDWVTSLAISPDGVLLASADRSGGLYVWESLRGREFHKLPEQAGAISALAWRADSNRLAVAGEEGMVRVYEMEDGKEVQRWKAKGPILDMDYLRDGRLVTAGRDGKVRLWNQDGKDAATFGPFEGLATSVASTPDGDYLVVGDYGGLARVLESSARKKKAEIAQLRPNPATDEERALSDAQALLANSELELGQLLGELERLRGELPVAEAALTSAKARAVEAVAGLQEAELRARDLHLVAVEASAQLESRWETPLVAKRAELEATRRSALALDEEAAIAEASLLEAVSRLASAEELLQGSESDADWAERARARDTQAQLLEGATASAQLAGARAAEARVSLVRREAEVAAWEQRLLPHRAEAQAARERDLLAVSEAQGTRAASEAASLSVETLRAEEASTRAALVDAARAVESAQAGLAARRDDLETASARWAALEAALSANDGELAPALAGIAP